MLMVKDMSRAIAFYRDVMGLKEGFISEHWTELLFGDAVVALHAGGTGERTPTGLSLQFEDVAQAYQAALDAGAMEIARPVQRPGEPIILGTLADPEGNEIMLTQYVGF